MRSLMIKHAAKITAINPSAARFAHEEMLGFMLVRISVLGNIFSARDLHSSLFSFRVPHCASYAMSLAYRRSRINCQRYLAPPRAATLERSGALTQTSRLLLWNRPVRFFFSVCAVTNFAPISSPLTQASSQRRYVRPVDDNRRKNSLSFRPSIESRMLSLAPVSDTSCMLQSRRHVPSIAMIETSMPFSKTTLTPLRRSEVATLCTQDELFSQVTDQRLRLV